ncbi:MAG: hypothetical protein KFH98_00330 [Gemmatimonadetes bacterium]|nr:hypothetical protein [Gemmatimonadota bacterium]
MKCRFVVRFVALMLLPAATIHAQERPGVPSADRPHAVPGARGAPAQDTVAVDTARGPRLRLRGGLVSNLPVDYASRLLMLFPGFMQSTSGERAFRGPGAYVATYVDGVPVRSLISSGTGIIPPVNGLRSLSLTTGNVPASYVGAAVIDYVTHTGGEHWTGDVRALSDALAPAGWNQHRTRFELQSAGPVPGVAGLRLALAGQTAGQKYAQLPGSGPVFVASGIDTTIAIARTGGDSVNVAIPNYETADFKRLPLGNANRSDLTTALTFERGSGQYGLRYYRTSAQTVSRDLGQLYNADAWSGRDDVAQVVSLSLQHPLALGVDADVVLSHQRHDATSGMLAPSWAAVNAQPTLGIMRGSPGFLADRADWPVTEPALLALRSGVLPARVMTFTSTDNPLVILRQGVPGVAQTLRINPYGARFGFPISGVGNASDIALSWGTERRWYGRAELSRQFGASGIAIGGEVDRSTVEGLDLPLADGVPALRREKPRSAAAFMQASTSMQNLTVNAGLRVEQHTSDRLLPRVPGFTTFIPDSLRGDAWILRAGDEPWEQRLERVVDCGGAATAAERTNPATGALVCKDNFMPVATHTEVSPRIALEYPDVGRFSFRASFGSYVQPRNLLESPRDLAIGGTSTPQPSDVEPVRERLAEVGVRTRTSGDSWVDLQIFRLDVSNPVSVGFVQVTNPLHGAPVNILTRLNANSEISTGMEVTALQHLSSWSGLLATFGYSQLDVELDGGNAPTRTDPVRAAVAAWVDLGQAGGSGPVAAVLNDMSVHAVAAYSEGARYTRLTNVGDGQLVGLLRTATSGVPAEELNASKLPARRELDLRIAKGFRLAGVNARVVADLRNPLGFDNVHTVYAETGTTENLLYAQRLQQNTLLTYSGMGTLSDMVIDDWTVENEVNRYMLRSAERRYGNGDGIFTVGEMTAAVDAYLDLMAGPQWLRDDARELRLGVEVRF